MVEGCRRLTYSAGSDSKTTGGHVDDIGAVLKTAIIDSGRTHYDIGKSAGVNTAVIDRFVSGQRDIRLETAGRISHALGFGLKKLAVWWPAMSFRSLGPALGRRRL